MKVCVCVRAVFSSKQARLGVTAGVVRPAWEAKVRRRLHGRLSYVRGAFKIFGY